MSCNCEKKEIFKNDDTRAFKRTGDAPFIRINRPRGLADDIEIYKAEFKCGNLPVMVFENIVEETPQPLQFPIDINPTADQTKQFQYQNTCYLKVYDVNGYGQTCNGSLSFIAKTQVV